MLIKKILGLLLISLASPLISFGQSDIPGTEGHEGTFTFALKRNGNEMVRSGNAVIKQLALHLTKAPDRTNYSVDYSYKLLSLNNENGKRQLRIRVDVSSIYGDTTGNGFNICKALSPGLVSFDLRLLDDEGNNPDPSSFVNIIPGRDTILNLPLSGYYSSATRYHDIALSKVVFGYDKKGIANVIQLFKSINTYKASALLADFARKQADVLNRKATNPSPEMLLEIYELSGAIDLLSVLQSQWSRNNDGSDPKALASMQRILAYRLHYIQQLFLANAATKNSRQSRSNVSKLSHDWVSMQVKRLTDQTTPEYARLAFYQMGKVQYKPNDLAFLKKAVSLIVSSTRPDAFATGCCWALSDAVIKAYLREANKLSVSGHFTEATDLLQSAARMCTAIPYTSNSDRLYQQQAIAIYGIFHSYLSIAQKALDGNKPALANNYADAAAAFQSMNSRYIITDLEVRKLYGQVAEAWYRSVKSKQESGNSVAAKADLSRAELALKSAKMEFLPGSPNLNLPLPFPEEEGAKSENENAVASAALHVNSNGSNMDRVNIQAAFLEIQRILDNVRDELEDGNCLGAFDLLDNVRQLMIVFGLPEEDPLIEKAADYWNEADSCQCTKAKGDFDRLIGTARELSERKDYIKAYKTCSSAIELFEGNSSCNLNSDYAEILRNTIHWPAIYQQMVLRIDSLVNSGLTAQAVDLYQDAGGLFAKHNLQAKGLEHLPLAEYAGSKHNYDLYAHSISELLYLNRTEEALTLLSRMEADKFTPEQCRESQELVADKIARRDSTEVKPVQVHQRLLSYTGGSGWYSHFRKMYLKAINSQ